MALLPAEASHLALALAPCPVASYGTAMWTRQAEAIVRLNTQAHADAVANGGSGGMEEIVPETLLTHDKLNVLVHELVAAGIYMAKVHPNIEAKLKAAEAPRAGLLAYYESVVANLIEVSVSSPYARTGDELLISSHDCLIDLVDWCVYRVRLLLGEVIDEVCPVRKSGGSGAGEMDVAGADRTQQLVLATSALSILRCICQVLSKLPLSVQSHVAREVDVPMLCCHLLLQKSPPWNREKIGKDKVRTFEYLQDGEWRAYKYPQERYVRITKIPGQLWLCLYSVLSVENGQLYALNQTRSQALGQVAKLINQALADQLPFLTQLRGALESATMRFDQQVAAVNSVPNFAGASDSRKSELEALYASMNDPSRGNSRVGLLNTGFIACEVAEIHEAVEKEIELAALGTSRMNGGMRVVDTGDTKKEAGQETKRNVYEIIGERILSTISSLTAEENKSDARSIGELFGKQFEDAVGATAVHYCKGCGAEATLRCSRCKAEWYCGRQCQIKCWKEHKKVCKPPAENTLGEKGTTSDNKSKTDTVILPEGTENKIDDTTQKHVLSVPETAIKDEVHQKPIDLDDVD